MRIFESLIRAAVMALLVVAATTAATSAATSREVQARVDADVAVGKPLVVHVVAALCDNANQGIVPVPEALGNGQDPGTNLYWGALYGIRTHLPRSGNWTRMDLDRPDDQRILERILLHAEVERNRRSVSVYIVADAWDGASIREALSVFLEMAAGRSAERVTVKQQAGTRTLHAGGASHLVAFVGHNGLMDFSLEAPAPPAKASPAKSAIVLACASRSYFSDDLHTAGAHPILLTTGLMAPEAYTLDSAIRAWVAKGTTAAVIEEAAGAYDRYQKCGLTAARRLFWGEP